MAKRKDLIKIRDVPALILKMTGCTRTQATVYMWTRKGIRAYDGSTAKLKVTKRLGHLYTTKKWVEEFLRSID